MRLMLLIGALVAVVVIAVATSGVTQVVSNSTNPAVTGNFQLMARLPAALLPWRNPIWWQFVSHKVLRLGLPWALLGTLILGARLDGWF